MTGLQGFLRNSVAAACMVLAFVETAWAQVAPVLPVPADDSGPGGAVAFVVVAGLLVMVGVASKVYDVKKKREDEAVELQSRLSDALLTEPQLTGLPISATVYVPLWARSPAVVVVSGILPGPVLHKAAIQLVVSEMCRTRFNYRIEDHTITADALMSGHAA